MPPSALSTGPLLRGLVDDAALFPPGNAPMPAGLAEHARYRAEPWSAALGPFLCPSSRVGELIAALPDAQPLRVSLVVDALSDVHQAMKEATEDARVTLVSIEAGHARLGDSAVAIGRNLARHGGLTGYLEVRREDIAPSLDLVEDGGWPAAKYRTGGVTADAYPDEAELAAFLLACVARGLPFKLTAGLHHAARNTSPEGFEQHGVLNVLVAVRLAQDGESGSDVEKVLALRDAEQLIEAVRAWTDDEASAVRTIFRSFGCCGVTDPLGDLAALGLLEDYR